MSSSRPLGASHYRSSQPLSAPNDDLHRGPTALPNKNRSMEVMRNKKKRGRPCKKWTPSQSRQLVRLFFDSDLTWDGIISSLEDGEFCPKESLCRKHLADLLGTTGDPLPERLSTKSDMEEREKQYQRAMKACEEQIGNSETHVEERRSHRQSLTLFWKWFISVGSTMASLPELSPSATTPGMLEIVPITPRQSSDHLSVAEIQAASPPSDDLRESRDSQLLSRKRRKLTEQAAVPALDSQPIQPINMPQQDVSGVATPPKPEDFDFTNSIVHIQRRLSILRISVASALTIHGSRASRWSKRLSHRSLENVRWVGCEDCSEPVVSPLSHDNVAIYLLMNGPVKDEAGLFTEVSEMVHGGCDINGRTLDGETTLHLATGGGFQSICRFLLNHAADVYAVTNHGETIGKYGKRLSRATEENVPRYARIKWCLIEVKKHKMYHRPSPSKKSKQPLPIHFQHNISPARPGPSVKTVDTQNLGNGAFGHARNSLTFGPSPSFMPLFNNGVSSPENIGVDLNISSYSAPQVLYSHDPQPPTEGFTASSVMNYGMQPLSTINDLAIEPVPVPSAQAYNIDLDPFTDFQPATSQPYTYAETREPQQYQFTGASQITTHPSPGWSQCQHLTPEYNVATASDTTYPFPVFQQSQSYEPNLDRIMPMGPSYSLPQLPQYPYWASGPHTTAFTNASIIPAPERSSIPPLAPRLHARWSAEFNPDCAPMLSDGQLTLAERLAYTVEPWQDSGILRPS